MPKKNRLVFLIYLLIFLEIGLIFTEFVLNLKGSTLCKSYGCEVLDQFIEVGRQSFLVIAFFYFLNLLVFLYLYNQTKGYLFRLIFLLLLGGGFSAELVFSLRQLIDINLLCSFCLTVTLLFFVIFIFSLIYLSSPFSLSELGLFLAGVLGSLVISFYLTSINLKPIITFNNPSPFWLIYSENCAHCKEVIEAFKDRNVNLNLIQLSKAYPFMKKLSINQVPTLIYKKSENDLEIFFGKDKILEVLNLVVNKTDKTDISEVKLERTLFKSKTYQSSKSKLTSNRSDEACEDESRGVCEVR